MGKEKKERKKEYVSLKMFQKTFSLYFSGATPLRQLDI